MDEQYELIDGSPPPPVHHRTSGRWSSLREKLKEDPGRWARIPGYKDQGSAASGGQRFRGGGFEATSRKEADGTGTLYVRWPVETSE